MKWNQVTITPEGGDPLTNIDAKNYVVTKCPDLVTGTSENGHKFKSDTVALRYKGKYYFNPKQVQILLKLVFTEKGLDCVVVCEDVPTKHSGQGPVVENAGGVASRRRVNVAVVFITKLKVQLVARDGKELKSATVKLDNRRESKTREKEGIANFGPVKVGPHTLAVTLHPDDATDYATTLNSLDDTLEIDVRRGEDKAVIIVVEPLFKKVQFIAYCLLTIPQQIWTGNGDLVNEANGYNVNTWPLKNKIEYWDMTLDRQNSWKSKYNGKNNDDEDMPARIELLRFGLDKAHERMVPDKPDELKVFIVPECFFLGRYGAYEIATVEALIGKLQDLVKDPKWRSWIFVFGTVNGSYEAESFEDMFNANGPFAGEGVHEMFNISPIIKGGFEDSDPFQYTKLIRKWRFSQELPGEDELIHHDDEVRTPLTEDAVQGDFGPTENETKVGTKVREILKEIAAGAPEDSIAKMDWELIKWTALKTGADVDLKDRGLTALVRDVRAKNFEARQWMEDLRSVLEKCLDDGPEKEILLKAAEWTHLSYKDACISTKRVPGPWLGEVVLSSDETTLAAKLTFGLEICADHINGRLHKAIKNLPEVEQPKVDIQLVPSAGAQITKGSLCMIDGGYVINCDGWAAPGYCGGPRGRNAKIIQVTNEGENAPWQSGINPLFPHSELWKADQSEAQKFVYVNDDITVVPLTRDVREIFAYQGEADKAGELHIYPVQDLP